MIRKVFFLYLLVGTISLFAREAEHEFVKDLKEQWLIYRDGQFKPYISTETNATKTLSFFIPPGSDELSSIRIKFNSGGSIFVNSNLLLSNKASVDVFWNLDSLGKLFVNEKLFVTLYFEDGNMENVITQILKPLEPNRQESSFFNILMKKEDYSRHQSFILLFLFFCIYMAIVRKFFWQEFLQLFSPFNIFSDKREELSSRTRFMVFSNIFLLASIPFSLTLIWLYIKEYHINSFFSHDFMFQVGLHDLRIVFLVVYALILIKYFLLTNLSKLFSLHFFFIGQYLKGIKLMIFGFGLIMTVMTVYSLISQHLISSSDILVCGVALVLIRALVLGIKLIRNTSFKKLHLFSYLCATEIVPQFLLLNFFLS